MDAKTLATIKQDLEERRDKIKQELSKFTEGANDQSDVVYPETGGNAEDENAAEVADYTDKLSLEQSLESSLHDIEKALENIEAGTYGVCRYCNEPIDEKRLLARPSSSACIACKNRLTKNS